MLTVRGPSFVEERLAVQAGRVRVEGVVVEDAAVEMVLHEEVVRPTTERVAVRRARVQRVVVRERRTIEVDVAHEEYRVVYEDVDPDAARELLEPAVASVSMVLREERIEIVRRVVPVERVVTRVVQVAGSAQVEVPVSHEEAEIVQDASGVGAASLESSSIAGRSVPLGH